MTSNPVGPALRAVIDRDGPQPFSEVMRRALYGPGGFYEQDEAGAGRRRDFLTSPEIGPLFGAVIARALDRWWADLGRPDPFVVYDVGAGPGTLSRSVQRAEPRCRSALDYVMVDPASGTAVARDAAGARTVDRLPPRLDTAVILANELLDNLPFDIAERTASGWCGLHVDVSAEGFGFVPTELLPDAHALLDRVAPDVVPGGRVPLMTAARAWVSATLGTLRRGRLVVIDYGAPTGTLARRDGLGWLRTYAAHERGADPLTRLGRQDITTDVAVDQLADVRPPDADRSQADALADWGIADLVAAGQRTWEERAHLGDLIALEGRSRTSEAAALTDLDGLGGFRVLEWVAPSGHSPPVDLAGTGPARRPPTS